MKKYPALEGENLPTFSQFLQYISGQSQYIILIAYGENLVASFVISGSVSQTLTRSLELILSAGYYDES